MRILCPHCGERGNEEFTYLGDATVRRPDGGDADSFAAWVGYVYMRANSAGLHQELWHHVHGCRSWLLVTRDVRNHQITSVHDARTAARARELAQ